MFVQGLRDYIASLCDCLQDKTAIIEELEDHLRRIRRERGPTGWAVFYDRAGLTLLIGCRERRAQAAVARQTQLLSEDVARGQTAIAAALGGEIHAPGHAPDGVCIRNRPRSFSPCVAVILRGGSQQEARADVERAWAAAEDAALQDHLSTPSSGDPGAARDALLQRREERDSIRAAALDGLLRGLGLQLDGAGGAVRLAAGGADLDPDWALLFGDALEQEPEGQGALHPVATYLAERWAHRCWDLRRDAGCVLIAFSFRLEVLEAAGTTLNDVDEEYSDLVRVKARMEEWKARFPGAYRDSFFSATAPALFSPFVRLELLFWEPLFPELQHSREAGAAPEGPPVVAAFDQLRYYESLFDYGTGLKDKFPDSCDKARNRAQS